ncbi:MAG: hypothetical protein AAFV85_01295 [Cyanobacteria bacterium J06634_6]
MSLGTACPAVSNPNVSIAAAVTPSIGCEIGTQNNGTVGMGVLQVNNDKIFNFDDWNFLGKDASGGSINISNTFPGNVLSGTWDISALVQSNWTDVMLVFKGGQGGPITPDNYVSYLSRWYIWWLGFSVL